MIITFCGHSDYVEKEEDENKIIKLLEKKIKDSSCDFYLGEYGNFDKFCYTLAKRFKSEHLNSNLIFVTPYIDESYLKRRIGEEKSRFDSIIYPELENIPLKYAISYRNRWIAEKADFIIAFIKKKYGGAYAMYKYAERIGKEIYNIAE